MSGATLTAEQMWRDNLDPIPSPLVLLVELWEVHAGMVHRYARCPDEVVSNGQTYDPEADCNMDGRIDTHDFVCYLRKFAACF